MGGCIDMCTAGYIDTVPPAVGPMKQVCLDMCIDICIDMCIFMCLDLFSLAHVSSHWSEHV